MKFYDGVVQTVKHIHVKAFSKDQVRNVVLCFCVLNYANIVLCFSNKDITCASDDKSLFPPSDSLTRKFSEVVNICVSLSIPLSQILFFQNAEYSPIV